MRALVSRGLLVSPLVCAAIVLGPVGTAAAAVDVPPVSSGSTVGEIQLSEADPALEWLDALLQEDQDHVFAPLLGALTALAERGEGRLDAREAAAHAKALTEATASLEERLGQAEGGATRAAAADADPVSDLTAQIQAAVGGLVSSLTKLDLGGVGSAIPQLLSSVVGLVTGLPSLPTT